jgi:hypothetical protein
MVTKDIIVNKAAKKTLIIRSPYPPSISNFCRYTDATKNDNGSARMLPNTYNKFAFIKCQNLRFNTSKKIKNLGFGGASLSTPGPGLL